MSDTTPGTNVNKPLGLLEQMTALTVGHTVSEAIEALAMALAITVGIGSYSAEAAEGLLKDLSVGMSQVVADRWTSIGQLKALNGNTPSVRLH